MKYSWKVAPLPVGKYRSFQRRGWPTAETADGDMLASIDCVDDYRPRNVKDGNHKPLRVRIRCKSMSLEEAAKHGGFRWLRLTKEFATLDEAKAAFKRFVDQNPQHPFI